MDDPNITMKEYIRLEEEKARKCGKVFNWETAKYGKIWYDKDIHNLRSIETEFPAITFNDQISSEKTLSYEPIVSSLNDEIDFGISFDDSDDEDYMSNTAYPLTGIRHMALPPRDQRHQYLMYEGLQYIDADIVDFETRLARIYRREVHRIGISSSGDFLGTALSYTSIRDLILRLCHRYLRLFAAGRKSGALISRGQFVALLAEHSGLLMEERLRGLTIIAPTLPVIDMAELVRSQIYVEIDDTWASVALGPERQHDAAASVPGAAEDAPVVDEGDQAVPAPVQAPQQPPPPPPPAAGRTMPQRLGT
ncbi:hypothetical protein Tco_1072990 [Tanacetum coccineum]